MCATLFGLYPYGEREPLKQFMRRSDDVICALFRKHHLPTVTIEDGLEAGALFGEGGGDYCSYTGWK